MDRGARPHACGVYLMILMFVLTLRGSWFIYILVYPNGAPNINSLPLDNSMFRILTAVQQFMTAFSVVLCQRGRK
jgi:hypothetical protein